MSENTPHMQICGGVTRGTPNPHKAYVYRWICPYCQGTGRWSDDGERCMNCVGSGVTNDVQGWDEADLTAAPRPPAVMPSPCVDCAYRPGSPEDGDEMRPGPDVPFFCHHGLIRQGDGYQSSATCAGMPLGAMVCAGRWSLATGGGLPVRPFRDPGGSDRTPGLHGEDAEVSR